MTPRTYSSERRAEGAALTRSEVLQSALSLFVEQGYSAVTMPQIADRARVSVATVYSSVGGKSQLFIALFDEAARDVVIDRALQRVAEAETPSEVVRAIGHGTRSVSERHQWLMTTLYDNAGAEPAIAARVQAAQHDLRENCARAAERIRELNGAVDQPLSETATVLLFFFGVAAWRALRDSGWSWDRAEQWLVSQALHALGLRV